MIKQSVLIVAAHPDDEVLGCGGTIAKHIKHGDKVDVLILAEGITSRAAKNEEIRQQEMELKALKRSAYKAKKVLGIDSLTLHNFPDNRMDTVALLDVIKVIETHVDKLKPEIVYTHHSGDLNVDHKLTHDAVVTACRPLPGSYVKTLLFFEVVSSTELQTTCSDEPFKPNWFTDITDTLETKLKALDAYQSEMRKWPHPRSRVAVEYLAMYRGSNIGCEAAEAFVLGRHLIRQELK